MEKIRVIKMLNNQIDAPPRSGALVLVGRVIVVGGGVMAKPNDLERGQRRKKKQRVRKRRRKKIKGKGKKLMS